MNDRLDKFRRECRTMKQGAAFGVMTFGAVLVGFVVVDGTGKETRETTPLNVTTDFDGGFVTICANAGNALRDYK